MDSSTGEKASPEEKKKPFPGGFVIKLRKRHIIETLAAFIGGGWLLIEVVERLLVGHYRFPEETIDLTVISVIGALLSILVWRWFRGTEKRPGNVRVEVLLVPLIILTALCIDLNILFDILGVSGLGMLTVIIALCLGIAWVVFKSLRWAASTPEGPTKRLDIFKLPETKLEKSIAVLPFENLSPDPENAFFADGLTEELIADLSKVQALRVISRTSAMMYKGVRKSAPVIAQELAVRYVLEGSVRRAGNSLRITAQLIDSETDSHLWAEKYQGTLEDVFALQEQMSRRIVEGLQVKLTPEEDRRLAARPIPDIRAYDAWLRASQEIWAFTKDAFDRAYNLIHGALEIVGENALLFAGLGFFHALAYDFGISHDLETLERGEQYASRALKLDPALGQAHVAMAYVHWKKGDFARTVREARRAAERDRTTDALWMLGFVLAEIGRIPEARRFADEAVSADPLNTMAGFARGAVELLDGLFADAAAWFRKYLEKVEPGHPILLWWLGQSLAQAGRDGEARVIFEQAVAAKAVLISDMCALYCQAAQGDRSRVRQALEANTLLQEAAKTDEYFPNFIAACLARVGDHEGALDWLERSVAWGFTNHRFLSEHSRLHAPLRGNPRFEALIRRAQEKEQAFEV